MGLRPLIVCALALGFVGAAAGQPARGKPRPSPQPEDVLPLSELDVDDPIGVDADSRTLGAAAPQAPKPPSDREAAAERARFGPEPPALTARAGEVLTALPGTRERAHAVRVQLAPGLTRVQVEMQFESLSARPSELRYRLAVPRGSRLFVLEVCAAGRCRRGIDAPGGGGARAYAAALLARPLSAERALPLAHAALQHDARGDAIVVRAAPVAQTQPLQLRIGYLAPAELHGGVVRLALPARGMDPQVAPAELRLEAPDLIDPRIDGAPAGALAQGFDPWAEVALSARAPSALKPRATLWQFACGAPGQRCGFAHVWAGPKPSTPVDLVIALDVSPSTEGEARGRLVAVVAGLLAVLPEGSRVRALAFAGRALALIEQPMEPARVALEPFSRAVAQAELGSATRFEAVWELAGKWLVPRQRRGLRPLIAIVGDGGLTVGEARAFERARGAGVEVSAINAADRQTPQPLREGVQRAAGIAVHAAAEGEAAARGRDPGALHDKLRALFAPTLARSTGVQPGGARIELGALRAGEQRQWQGLVRGALRMQYGGKPLAARPAPQELGSAALAGGAAAVGGSGAQAAPAAQPGLAAIDVRDLALADQGWPEQRAKAACDRRGPARRHGGLSTDAQPLALAVEPVCKPPPKSRPGSSAQASQGRGMPADPLLSMLRQRILPVARGCFRRDRAGRAQYEKRAVFVFTLADREVVAARVEGSIPRALQQCLLAAVDTLEVPRFSGTVMVRYPLVTESLPLPEQIELQAQTAGTIDRLFGEPSQ